MATEEKTINQNLSTEQRDLLSMLTSELQSHLEETIDRQVALKSPESQSGVEVSDEEIVQQREHLEQTANVLDTFANAAQLMGLDGLANAWRHLEQNFKLLSEKPVAVTEEQRSLIDAWALYFLELLQKFSESALTRAEIQPLTDYLADVHWPLPLSEIQIAEFSQQLTQSAISLKEDKSSQLPTKATPVMMSLRLTEDINPELFDGLMVELPNQVAQFSHQLDVFLQDQHKAALASAQRIAHTLKGSANVVGISGLANFMHFSEDLLEEIAKRCDATPPEDLTLHIKILFTDMGDTLAAILDNLLTGANIGDLELQVMQEVLNAYHAIKAGGIAAYEMHMHSVPSSSTVNKKISEPKIISATQDEFKSLALQELNQKEPESPDLISQETATTSPHLQDTTTAHIRIKEDTAQDLLRLAGESAISTNRIQTQVTEVKDQVQHIHQLHNKLTQLAEEFGHLIEVQELFSNRSNQSRDQDLDPLELDRYNELHSFFHQLQEFATDTRDAIYQTQGQIRQLENLTYDQQVTNRSSQSHLLEMRMIPANYFEARFQRCVRQACRLTGKQVGFEMRGAQVMIDSHILHELVDPIMHLLRNAVDHGIEFADERQAHNKPLDGKVVLEFAMQGQSILVRVSDDGAGLQKNRIKQKAEALSLTPPTQSNEEVYDHWLKQIIFAPGFSTREQVSQTSGRGIGLDMVADRVTELNGRIAVESAENEGCVFTIRLPMPMISEQGLLVVSGKHRIVVAARGIEQLLFLEKNSLVQEGDQWRYHFNQKVVDVYPFASIAKLSDVQAMNPHEARALLMIEIFPNQVVGVLVEKVITSREMVVKPLSHFTPQVSGVMGATILGDGEVAPVIDLQHLVLDLLQSGSNLPDWSVNNLRLQTQAPTERPMALIVDDSLSTRRSLAQFVSDLGLEVRTAKDGFEAIDILHEQIPKIMLVDMEMPRMNGLELTAHLRANDATKNVPVIMITSRNTDKHRNLAAAAGVDTYLNKPYSEEELLHYIQESMQQSASVMSIRHE